MAMSQRATDVFAQSPQVRATIDSDVDALVGQPIVLKVDILVPGIMADSPVFDLPHVPDVLIMPPIGSPVIGSEELDGTSYTVQHHELFLLARKAGQHEIPPIHVRFSFKLSPLDKDAIIADTATPAVTFKAAIPPGAEALNGLICATSLEVQQSWRPTPRKAEVGDAFTRTIEYSAPGVPGMAFPPWPEMQIDGLRIYSTAPQISDEVNRGELVGKRRDTITYVCERPGHFVIPAVQLTWWNLDQKKLETITLPAQSIDVEANPKFVDLAARQSQTTNWQSVTGTAVIAALSLLAMLWFTFQAESGEFAFQYFQPRRLVDLNPDKTPARG
jgi:hypothetical protein